MKWWFSDSRKCHVARLWRSFVQQYLSRVAVALVGSVLVIVVAPSNSYAWTIGSYSNWVTHSAAMHRTSDTGVGDCAPVVHRSVSVDSFDVLYTTGSVNQRRLGYMRYGSLPGMYTVTISRLLGVLADSGAPVEAMYEEDVYIVTPQPAVSMALGHMNLPGASSVLRDGFVVLFRNGTVRVWQRYVGGLSAPSWPWPASYELVTVIPPPPLPEGIDFREYCDVVVLPDGDIVATFAQGPPIQASGEDHLVEGWVRYERTSGVWEDQVISVGGQTSLHPGKEGSFIRSECMSVTANVDVMNSIFFVSNAHSSGTSFYSTSRLMKFQASSSGVFPVQWVRSIPNLGSGYGEIEGIAVLSTNRFIIHADHTARDRLHVLREHGATLKDDYFVFGPQDAMDVAAIPVVTGGSCPLVRAFAGAEVQPSGSYTEPGQLCPVVFEMEVGPCVSP